MLGVRRQTPTLGIYGDTGHSPLLLKQQVQTLKYWARLIALPDNHILKNAYNCLLGLGSIGIDNWTTHVKTLTFNMNLASFWETQTIERRCRFINNVKQQTEDKFIDDWTEKISCENQQTKLKTYNTFSFFPKFATYVSDLTDTRLIAAVARLRLSSHNLEIERGRHTRPKTPVGNRICRRCQTTQVDDKIHFLMQCNIFELDRKALLSEAGKYITNFNTQCDTEQFKSIMSSENHAIINALAKYTYVCFEKIVV